MPKNKNKPNAFLFFMLEWKKKEEKRGRHFPNGLKDVQIDPECNAKWKALSEQDKAYYKQMEKTTKAKPNQEKRTGCGEKLSDIERAQRKEQEFMDNMSEYIASLIHAAKECNQVHKLQFYVIHVNFFYTRQLDNNNDVEYYPAEFAITEFSLEKGVIRVYNEIINEKIKTGYASTAKEYSMNFHNIPIDAPFGKSNYQEIFKDICKFIEPGKKDGKYPPLYTIFSKENFYYPAKSFLSRLAIASQRPEDYLLLYSFEDLFSNINNAIQEQNGGNKIEPMVATIELKKDPFAYKSGLECEYHGELKAGAIHCSQSHTKRWIFVLCSYCCEPLSIPLVAGTHKPPDLDLIGSFASLNSSFSTMSLSTSRGLSSTLSMTGVGYDYRERVSERTVKDDQRRRAEANAKPIEIIDHSVMRAAAATKKVQEPVERPLRPPHTKSANTYYDSTDTESLDFSENSFPSIGRGSAIKKKADNNKNSIGHGYAARLKS